MWLELLESNLKCLKALLLLFKLFLQVRQSLEKLPPMVIFRFLSNKSADLTLLKSDFKLMFPSQKELASKAKDVVLGAGQDTRLDLFSVYLL